MKKLLIGAASFFALNINCAFAQQLILVNDDIINLNQDVVYQGFTSGTYQAGIINQQPNTNAEINSNYNITSTQNTRGISISGNSKITINGSGNNLLDTSYNDNNGIYSFNSTLNINNINVGANYSQ